MKRTGLMLLTCLLLALCTAAQAPQKAAPDDLVVTAEIVGHSYEPAKNDESKSRPILYVKLNVRNQTNQLREVVIMSCGWDNSWLQQGAYGFCGWGCDKNISRNVAIPAGQSLVFHAPVCQLRKNTGEMKGFRFGFSDAGGCYSCIPSAKRRHQYLEKHAVYWSNELNGIVDLTTMPEIKGSDQYPRYSLPGGGK